MHVITLNCGSSSLKFALYRVADKIGAELVAEGAVERIGQPEGSSWIRGPKSDVLMEASGNYPQHKSAVAAALAAMEELSLPKPDAVGHRIVHGGPNYTAPAIVDTSLLSTVRGLVPFAPLHLPIEIQGIEAATEHLPRLPQVACFDTAFHRNMPELAQRLPLRRSLWQDGIRRYGFHGLSYEYVVEALGPAARGRVVIAHLGNGVSLAAVRDGQAVDTTMGFTPTGGVMMGTRSGDLDPGILLYLLGQKGYDVAQIDSLVNYQAGLLGVSEISSDMEALLRQRESQPSAAQAVEMFCYHLRKHIGALTAVLGGIDTLVFTGGMGERAAAVRWSVCEGLGHLGIELDAEQNEHHAATISKPGSPCTVQIIPTNENLIIARQTARTLATGSGSKPRV